MLQQHPDKTLIGRTERGFDFIGYHFALEGLTVADKTIKLFKEHIARLYEQVADSGRIGQYVYTWFQWVQAGFSEEKYYKVHAINWGFGMPHLDPERITTL